MWDVSEGAPNTISKALYAASQKNIETMSPPAAGSGPSTAAAAATKHGSSPPGQELLPPTEQPLEVHNLASYFDKMQVKKPTPHLGAAVNAGGLRPGNTVVAPVAAQGSSIDSAGEQIANKRSSQH